MTPRLITASALRPIHVSVVAPIDQVSVDDQSRQNILNRHRFQTLPA